MCHLCDLIDYPVADCWRPCYVPGQKAKDVRDIRKHSGQDYFESAETIATLQTIIKQQRARQTDLERENEALRLRAAPNGQDASRQSFEGIE